MANTTTSTNMQLPVPVPTVDPGPDWATNLVLCLQGITGGGGIDGHNHTTGQGVKVPSAGININADLTFANFNATNLRTLRFQPLSAAPALGSDIGCAYELNGDFWFNNSTGTQIQITASGAPAASPTFTVPLLMSQVTTPSSPASGKDKFYVKSDDTLYVLTSAAVENRVLYGNVPLLLDQSTTPANPASGKDKVYFKSDDSLYQLSSAGTEKRITPLIPTSQKFTASSGTYTTPAGVFYIRIRMIGGGGGGGGAGGAGGTGGNSTFGTALLVANGGVGGASVGAGPVGGTASLGSGPFGIAIQGSSGAATGTAIAASEVPGGSGGAGPFGGNGSGGVNSVGGAAVTNSGSGGGGWGGPNNNSAGAGGASGGFVDAIITAPAATYAYAVGAAGTAGTAGGGNAGGVGGAGLILVEEFYQ